MDERLQRILPRVQKPARYVGGEYNQIIKDKAEVRLRMAFCFPDTYEIGMSNLGMRILYGCLNDLPGVWCERVFAPWGDMEDEMRREGIPLWALESGDPVSDFDVVAFSLGYEMAYTNVLNMLDLSGIPLRSADRPGLRPLVFAGGTSCCNPEPLADFMDLMVLGEGEEIDAELLKLYQTALDEDWSKQQFLLEAAKLGGVYVPSLYEPVYDENGLLIEMRALPGAPETVTKRIISDFDSSYFPVEPIVPSTEIVHDRVTLELFRGCIRGCRFCQAGYVYRPVRSRSAEKLVQQGVESVKNTGYQQISLSSLSSSDYRGLPDLCDGLLDYGEARGISLALPSLRADNFSMDIMQRIQKVRRSGLTFAPEAGSQRLRDAINKNVCEADLLESCRVAFAGGWNGVKLYFMLGLPTETDEDIVAIAELATKVLHCWKQHASNKSRGVRITVSTSCFVPKPHTPFQWEAQVSMEEYKRRVRLLRETMTAKAITYNWHDPETSYLEAALSRGDRRVGNAIEAAWRSGAKMDSWSEFFSFERWMQAFESCGLDPAFYATRERTQDEVLPWSRVDMGVRADVLWQERERSRAATITPDCREKCSACGAACLLKGGKCDG
ncbi:MAG: TIGR03960 family B12-binding radical SAM protein [Oscillospiraceae bacterium]|nr:TIGR03960 family B12-binding radical SAM protein [Oscillospiraceae bacterium]